MFTQVDRMYTAPWEPNRSRPPWINIDPLRKAPGRQIQKSRSRRTLIPALVHIDLNIKLAHCDTTRVGTSNAMQHGQPQAELATPFA